MRIRQPQLLLRDRRSRAQRRVGRKQPIERIRDASILRRAQGQINVRKIVEIVALQFLHAQHADIGRLHHDLRRQLPLHAELPLLVVRGHAVRIQQREAVSRLRRQPLRTVPTAACSPLGNGFDRVVNGVAPLSVVPTNGVFGLNVGKLPKIAQIVELRAVEQPIAAAQNRLVEQLVSEAESRAEVVGIDVALRAGIAA